MGPETSCPQCGVANPAVALFCMACGASLARTCPACGASAPASARFCIACGATFDDNVMAVFGAPVAHEDDPERSVRAALGMQAAMADLNERLRADHGFEFALRVGVNTGEVLAGKIGDGYTVMGDAVNVASRLQTSASPGTITVGQRTQRATHETRSEERRV